MRRVIRQALNSLQQTKDFASRCLSLTQPPCFGVVCTHRYDTDWLVHSSDQDLNPYYRPFHTLEDSTSMDGNCAKAQPGYGRNEMYPCINDQVDYGVAITGVKGSGLPTQVETLQR